MNDNQDYEQSELYKIRHTTEHVFNQAVEELFPGEITRAMGPPVDDGWYNDSRWNVEISEEMFPKIEKRMQKIIDADLPMVIKEVSEEEAREMFKDNPFKQEFIDEFVGPHPSPTSSETPRLRGQASPKKEKESELEDLSEQGKLTVFYTGDPDAEAGSYKRKVAGEAAKNLPGDAVFVDLCKGPHVENTGQIKAFKLLSVAGAYWRGDEKNEMLTRVYGTAFENKEELEDYLEKLELAKERDHRKLNEVLDIFATSDLVGRGLIMYTPNGTMIRNQLRDYLLETCKKYGAQEVDIPHMAKIELYEKSGHAKKFADELFKVTGHYDNEYVLKPVNCPHHTQIFASRQRSYRELPISYVESTQQHRDEKPGAMVGLNRAVSFEIDDGHSFCTPEQIRDEAVRMINIIKEFYEVFGMWGDHWVSLSFRDAETPEKYIGDVEDWEKAQKMLEEINDELDLGGRIMEGEAALYGPKIDFMLKDALGNDRQLGTVQIDFAMPKSFELKYIDKDGKEKTPVMLHRAILGSYHRFIAYLLESTNGALPLWLHPTQVAIVPVSEKFNDYAEKVREQILDELPDTRVVVKDEDERMQKRIREAQVQKIPYMLIVGGTEEENSSVNVRLRNEEQLGEVAISDFISRLREKVDSKSLEI